MSYKRHQNVALGGTFDHLHDGHKALIKFAATWGEKLIIGVCDDVMSQGKTLPQSIQPLLVRKKNVGQFCQKEGIELELKTLSNPVGHTIEASSHIDALVVTTETVAGGNHINVIRTKLKLRELPIYICPMLLDANGQPIHSDQIRLGKISRSGMVYDQVLSCDVTISPNLRQALQQLKLDLVDSPSPDMPPAPMTAVVGDVTLKKFIDRHWPFNIGVFDNLVERQQQHLIDLATTQTVNNQAGQITQNLTQTLQLAISDHLQNRNKRAVIQVTGEEDLTSIALILLLPLYSRLYFGLPGKGLVEVTVTEVLKDKIYGMLTV